MAPRPLNRPFRLMRLPQTIRLICLALFGFALTCSSAEDNGNRSAQVDRPATESSVPAFGIDLPWLNLARPLSRDDLRGKVVILDFWTYGCINCVHVLEDLKRLEAKYGDQLLVIGVHTPKFDNEKNIETLRNIIVRYGIEHPVVHDTDFLLGTFFGMRAWPTQVLTGLKLLPGVRRRELTPASRRARSR